MDLIGFFVRPALSWIFVQGGLDSIRTPEPRAKAAATTMARLRNAAPATMQSGLPNDVVLVQINAAVQVAAGVALATGYAPRIAALILAGSLAPTTIGGHGFWRFDDPAQRGPQQIQFAKNTAIFGGLLLAATRRRPAREVITGP
ncbi:MAG: DoxX family membrane protein [Actinomycetota bacterium]|nr:DoxX family membrane protein [Actinomycetota bacterium]